MVIDQAGVIWFYSKKNESKLNPMTSENGECSLVLKGNGIMVNIDTAIVNIVLERAHIIYYEN